MFLLPRPAGDADQRPSGDDHAPAPLPVPRARTARAQRRRHADVARATRCARSGCCCAVAAVLFLLGGLVQINPIWQWGPYHPYLSENGAQPDWYIGWLIGALRLMPNWELGDRRAHAASPNPFWGGVAFPSVVFGVLFTWPALERRITGDQRRHDLLDRPRDHPTRTAIGAAFFSWVVRSSSPPARSTGSSSACTSPTSARSISGGRRSGSSRSSSTSWFGRGRVRCPAAGCIPCAAGRERLSATIAGARSSDSTSATTGPTPSPANRRPAPHPPNDHRTVCARGSRDARGFCRRRQGRRSEDPARCASR